MQRRNQSQKNENQSKKRKSDAEKKQPIAKKARLSTDYVYGNEQTVEPNMVVTTRRSGSYINYFVTKDGIEHEVYIGIYFKKYHPDIKAEFKLRYELEKNVVPVAKPHQPLDKPCDKEIAIPKTTLFAADFYRPTLFQNNLTITNEIVLDQSPLSDLQHAANEQSRLLEEIKKEHFAKYYDYAQRNSVDTVVSDESIASYTTPPLTDLDDVSQHTSFSGECDISEDNNDRINSEFSNQQFVSPTETPQINSAEKIYNTASYSPVFFESHAAFQNELDEIYRNNPELSEIEMRMES